MPCDSHAHTHTQTEPVPREGIIYISCFFADQKHTDNLIAQTNNIPKQSAYLYISIPHFSFN